MLFFKEKKITFIFVKYLFQLLVFYSTRSPLQISPKKAKNKKEKEKKKLAMASHIHHKEPFTN